MGGGREWGPGLCVQGVAQWVYSVHVQCVCPGWGCQATHPARCATAGAVELRSLGSDASSASHICVTQGT